MKETKTKWKKRKRTGGFWRPEKGAELIGKLENIRQGDYAADIYDIRTKDGIVTIPSSVVLRDVIGKDDVGKELRIKFLGWGKAKSGKFRDFEVSDVE